MLTTFTHIYTINRTHLRNFSMTYTTIAECTVNILLMMDRGAVRNM